MGFINQLLSAQKFIRHPHHLLQVTRHRPPGYPATATRLPATPTSISATATRSGLSTSPKVTRHPLQGYPATATRLRTTSISATGSGLSTAPLWLSATSLSITTRQAMAGNIRLIRPLSRPTNSPQIVTAFAVTLGFLFVHFFLVGMITGICLAVLYLILGGSIEGLDNLEQAEEVLTDVLFESTASTIISFVVLTIAYAISILATWLLIRYTWLKAPSRQINLRRPDRQDIICIIKYSTIQMGVFIGMIVLAYFFSDALGLENGTEKPVYRPDAPESSPYIGLIFGISIIGLLVPFIEEVIFRGVFFKALRKNLKFWLAFLLSGVLFTLLHYNNDLNAATNLYVFVQILALTYFMTLAYEKRRNLWVPISLHALHNLRIVILAAIIIAAGWDVGV